MNDHGNTLAHVALGAAAGAAGTFVMQALLAANKKLAPGAMPPIRRDPGEFMVDKAEELVPYAAREKIPDAAESAAAKSLHLGYGATCGALYAAARPEGGSPLTEGAALGLLTWAAGYLGWLPATGLMPPVWKQEPAQALTPPLTHALFGMATVAAYDLLHDQVLDA